MRCGRLKHECQDFIHDTDMTKPVYTIQSKTTIDVGAIVGFCVHEGENRVLETICMARAMKIMDVE